MVGVASTLAYISGLLQLLRSPSCLNTLGVQPRRSQLLHFVFGCEGLAHPHETVACFYFLADSCVVMLRKCGSWA